MDVRAAIALDAGKPLVVGTVQFDGARAGEVLIKIKTTGLCHTDKYTLSGADPEGCRYRSKREARVTSCWGL